MHVYFSSFQIELYVNTRASINNRNDKLLVHGAAVVGIHTVAVTVHTIGQNFKK